jgi:hypothetical protein
MLTIITSQYYVLIYCIFLWKTSIINFGHWNFGFPKVTYFGYYVNLLLLLEIFNIGPSWNLGPLEKLWRKLGWVNVGHVDPFAHLEVCGFFALEFLNLDLKLVLTILDFGFWILDLGKILGLGIFGLCFIL